MPEAQKYIRYTICDIVIILTYRENSYQNIAVSMWVCVPKICLHINNSNDINNKSNSSFIIIVNNISMFIIQNNIPRTIKQCILNDVKQTIILLPTRCLVF